MLRFNYLTTLLILFFATTKLQAQQPATPLAKPADSTKSVLTIIHADRTSNEKVNDSTELTSVVGHVEIQKEKTLFYADSAVLNRKANTLEAFGHIHINDADSVHTYSDYLKYIGKERKVYLKKNVRLTDGKGTLTTQDLTYDLSTKIGTYNNGGKLVSDKSVLTSLEGVYYGETRDVFFKKQVVLVDPQYTIKTDTLQYNTYEKKATFVSPTTIRGKNERVETTEGYYDTEKKQSYFGKRSTIYSDSTTLTADQIINDEANGLGEAQGNAILRDLKNGFTIIANNLKSNKKESAFLATQQPVMIMKQEKDSIFLAADTFYSAKITALKDRTIPVVRDKQDSLASNVPDSSRDRYVEAYYHVRIFSDSMQAVCDSMFYSAFDSTFRLFKQPAIWSRESQITGDTMYLFTGNKKPQRLYAFENGLIISKAGIRDFYNQVKGRTINGYFDSTGNIDFVRAKGNAENVYYAVDDYNKYVGVNKSSSNSIEMYFIEKQADKVKLISDVKGTTFPMNQVNHEELKLRGFKWLSDKRPKSKYDLFGN